MEEEKLIEAVRGYSCLWQVNSRNIGIKKQGKMHGKKWLKPFVALLAIARLSGTPRVCHTPTVIGPKRLLND